MRPIVRTLVVVAAAVALTAGPAHAQTARTMDHAPLPTSGAFSYRADASQYRGATSDLGFRLDVSTRGRLRQAWLIEASLDLPAAYANRYRARAELRVNGLTVRRAGHLTDTNGDARLEWYFGDVWLRQGDRVSVWFSDPVTRYAIAHPVVVV
jgi:hypothetical protein